jgi:hypothetical protein
MESKEMINLVMLGIIVLISGMVLWKISSLLTKGKRKPKGSNYFNTKMKDKYNNM